MDKVQRLAIRTHNKASERYVDVVFSYEDCELSLSVPIEYRRTGTDIPDDKIDAYLEEVYDKLHPNNWASWINEQEFFGKTNLVREKQKSFLTL